jgi:DNA invertase Pin-like site-specific DNA recombinase
MNGKIKAVAYYRMSSDKQETSIADQRIAVVKFAANNGLLEAFVSNLDDEGNCAAGHKTR